MNNLGFWLQCLLNLLFIVMIHLLRKRVEILENEKQERMNYLTDEEVIDAELERSARRREAFDSQMPYPPRQDSGPPAVVKPVKLTQWGKSTSRFKKKPRYGGEDRPQRYLPNQPEKDS
jgi:hypothetical protein